MINFRPKTIFCDIDGTLCVHENPSTISSPKHKIKLLPKTIEKLLDWNLKGYIIILITGRKESQRELTVKQLQEAGIFYDQLIMGITGGTRVLINDKKLNGDISTELYNPDRNYGIRDIKI